jgi:hypothetical protein
LSFFELAIGLVGSLGKLIASTELALARPPATAEKVTSIGEHGELTINLP